MFKNQIQGLQSAGGATLEERRRMIRVRCYCHVEVQQAGETVKGVVTDLGVDGLRLKCPIKLEEGARVSIQYPGAPPGTSAGGVQCAVIWSQPHPRYVESVSGLRYEDSKENLSQSWVRLVLQELGFDESRVYQRRKFIRANASIPARLEAPNRSQLPARVVNLGVGGALLEVNEEFPRDTQVTLDMSLWRILPTLSLPGSILDSRRDPESGLVLSGMRFSELNPQQIELLGKYVVYLLQNTES